MGFYWFSKTKSKVFLKCYHILLLQYKPKDPHSNGMDLKGKRCIKVSPYDFSLLLESRIQQQRNKQANRKAKKTLPKWNSTLKVSPFTREIVQSPFFVSVKIFQEESPLLPSLLTLVWTLPTWLPFSPLHLYSCLLKQETNLFLKLSSSLCDAKPLSVSSSTTAPLPHPVPSCVCYTIPLWAVWPPIHSHVSFTACEHPTSNPGFRWSTEL